MIWTCIAIVPNDLHVHCDCTEWFARASRLYRMICTCIAIVPNDLHVHRDCTERFVCASRLYRMISYYQNSSFITGFYLTLVPYGGGLRNHSAVSIDCCVYVSHLPTFEPVLLVKWNLVRALCHWGYSQPSTFNFLQSVISIWHRRELVACGRHQGNYM